MRSLISPLNLLTLLASPVGAPPPEAPTLTAPSAGTTYDDTITASSNPVEGATSYLFQLSREPDFGGILEQGTPTDPTFTFGSVYARAPSAFYIREAAVGPGGRSAWSPTVAVSVPMLYPQTNLALFLDGDRDIYANTALTTPATDDGLAAGWKDKSASGYHVTEGTANNQPTYDANPTVFAGRGGINFIASDRLLRNIPDAIVGNASAWEILILLAHSMPTGSNDAYTIYAEGSGTDNSYSVRININDNVAGGVAVQYRSGAVIVRSGNVGLNDGKPHVLSVGLTGGHLKIRVDGVEVKDQAVSPPALTGITKLGIGCLSRVGVGNYYVGWIGKLFVYLDYDAGHAAESKLIADYVAAFAAAAVLPSRDTNYPTPEGYAASVVGGGAGAAAVSVSNLNASGSGSLVAAMNTPGARQVKFPTLHGDINLGWNSPFASLPLMTLDFSNAGGDGICVRGGTLRIIGRQIYIYHGRFRPGLGAPEPNAIDGLSIEQSAHEIAILHASVTWSLDELLQIWGSPGDPHDFTIQDSLFAEPLDDAGHPEGKHGFGMLLDRGYYNISMFRNLIGAFDIRDRNPKMVGASSPYKIDWVNCVFCYHNVLPYFVAPVTMNMQGCTFVNLTSDQAHAYRLYGGTAEAAALSTFYANDNRMIKADGSVVDAVALTDAYAGDITVAPSRIDMPAPSSILSAADAYDYVLTHAGATLPTRDAVDARIIQKVIDRTVGYVNDPADVGGYPTL